MSATTSASVSPPVSVVTQGDVPGGFIIEMRDDKRRVVHMPAAGVSEAEAVAFASSAWDSSAPVVKPSTVDVTDALAARIAALEATLTTQNANTLAVESAFAAVHARIDGVAAALASVKSEPAPASAGGKSG